MIKNRGGCPDAKAQAERCCPVGTVCAQRTICQRNADLRTLADLFDIETLEEVEARLRTIKASPGQLFDAWSDILRKEP